MTHVPFPTNKGSSLKARIGYIKMTRIIVLVRRPLAVLGEASCGSSKSVKYCEGQWRRVLQEPAWIKRALIAVHLLESISRYSNIDIKFLLLK